MEGYAALQEAPGPCLYYHEIKSTASLVQQKVPTVHPMPTVRFHFTTTPLHTAQAGLGGRVSISEGSTGEGPNSGGGWGQGLRFCLIY